MVSNYRGKARANADLKIEDTKEGLIALLAGEGGGNDLHRAPLGLLDKVWAEAVAARGGRQAQADECTPCRDTSADAEDDGYLTG